MPTNVSIKQTTTTVTVSEPPSTVTVPSTSIQVVTVGIVGPAGANGTPGATGAQGPAGSGGLTQAIADTRYVQEQLGSAKSNAVLFTDNNGAVQAANGDILYQVTPGSQLNFYLGDGSTNGNYKSALVYYVSQTAPNNQYYFQTLDNVSGFATDFFFQSYSANGVVGTDTFNFVGDSYTNTVQNPFYGNLNTFKLTTTQQGSGLAVHVLIQPGDSDLSNDRQGGNIISKSGNAVGNGGSRHEFWYTPTGQGAGATIRNSVLGITIGNTFLFADGYNVQAGTTNGTKIGTSATQKFGFYNATPVVQQPDGAALTNSVTIGGTTNTIADITSLSVYSTDAATIRNNIYQLARKLKIVDDALRAYGLLS